MRCLHDKQRSDRNQFLNARGQLRTAIRIYISDEKAVGCLPRTAEVSSQAGRFAGTLPSFQESPFGRSPAEPHRKDGVTHSTQRRSQTFASRAGPLYAKILRLNPGKDAHKAGSDQTRLRTPEPHGPPTQSETPRHRAPCGTAPAPRRPPRPHLPGRSRLPAQAGPREAGAGHGGAQLQEVRRDGAGTTRARRGAPRPVPRRRPGARWQHGAGCTPPNAPRPRRSS